MLYKILTYHVGMDVRFPSGDTYENCDFCDQSPCDYHYSAMGSTELGRHVANAIQSHLGPTLIGSIDAT
jgi:hypothetical protein